MNINFELIVEKLAIYNPSVTIVNNGKRLINNVEFLEKTTELLKPDVLYIGRFSNLSEHTCYDSEINLVCISDKYISKKFLNSGKINLIVINNKMSGSMLNDINKTFFKSESASLMAKRLLKLLSEENGLQEIADVGLALIGNPVIILNYTNDSITCSNIELENIAWNELKNEKKFTLDTIIRYEACGILVELNQDQKKKSPFIFRGNLSGQPNCIGVNIFIKEKQAAQIVIPALINSFCANEMELAEILAHAVTLEIQKLQTINEYNKGYTYEYIIKDLLDGTVMDELDLNQRLINAGIKIKNYHYVLVISFSDFVHSDNLPDMNCLNNIIGNDISIIFNNYAVTVISRSSDNLLSKQEKDNINIFLKNNKLIGGLSQLFMKFGELDQYYQQSLFAIEQGQKNNSKAALHHYENYALDHLLMYTMKEANLNTFCHPIIILLKNYDDHNSTEYLETIYTFIKFNRDISKTSNELHIHKNTLNYRLKKISELIEIDWNNGELLAHMLLSIKLLRNFSDFSKIM